MPACLPAIRLTSSGRIEPVFSHNTEYQCANTDLFFRLRFIIHCALVSTFIFHPSLLLFLFECWKLWEITKDVSINCTAHTYYVMLMAKCMCVWLHHPFKLLTSEMFCCVLIQVNQHGFILWLIGMVLGCTLQIQLLLNHYRAHTMIDW